MAMNLCTQRFRIESVRSKPAHWVCGVWSQMDPRVRGAVLLVAIMAGICQPPTAHAAPHEAVRRTLFRGTLTQQEDRLLLAPCGGGKTVRVRDVSPEVIITAALTDIGFDRVDRLYLEAYGWMQDGELMIQYLNRAGVEMGCPKTRVRMRAQGNEPGWGLESTRKQITLARQGQPSLRVPPVALSWHAAPGNQHRPHAKLDVNTKGTAWRAVLKPKICRDTMADAAYGFTAVVQRLRPEPALELKGCGYLGDEYLPSAE